MCEEWKNLSLTGKLCYLFMCIEKYLVTCYPDKDWSPYFCITFLHRI